LSLHHDIFGYALDVVGVDVLAVESVPPSFTKGRDHVDDLTSRASDKGYATTIVRHDARYLGVAQRRERVFYVFHRVQMDWEYDFTEVLTVRQVLKSVGRHKTKGFSPTSGTFRVSVLLKNSPPGEKLRQTYDRLHPDPVRGGRGQKIGSPSFLEQRVAWDKPCPVLIASKLYHPIEDRFLDQEELAAMCSFPPDYKWPRGDANAITGYMSRGVMPKVGEWLAGNVARALETNRRINQPKAEVLDITGPPGRLYELQPRQEDYVAKSVQVAVPKGLPDRDEGEGSGAYIRRLLGLGAADDAILERVHAQFPGSKATKSDVAYNKAKLKKLSEDNAKAVVHLHRSGAGPAPPVIVEARNPKYAAKAVERLPFDGGTSSAQAVSALRAVVNKRATVPGLSALLNLSLDLMEKL
jgi:hypothetical protein